MGGKRHILFAGGGTIGHIAPLVAVMEAVHAKDASVVLSYVGTKADLEQPILKDSAFARDHVTLHAIAAGKLNRYLTVRHLGESARFARGVLQSWKLLKRIRPDCVLAKGGYVTVPVVLAANRLGIPVFCHESDVIPGLANRLVSKRAQTVFTAYPERYYTTLPLNKLRYVGQPVRAAFFSPRAADPLVIDGRTLDTTVPIVMVIGGSQGAHRLNELISAVWPDLLDTAQLVHLSGERDFEWLQGKSGNLSESQRERLWLLPSLQDELPRLFQEASLAISRAGGTIAELAATGTPTILVPLSTAAQDHQQANANVLVAEGAAVLFNEVEGTPADLAALISSLLSEPIKLSELSHRISAFSRPDAAGDMATALTE